MKANALLGLLAATVSLGAAAQSMDFGSGFGAGLSGPTPGISGISPLPPFLTNGLGASTLNDRVPGIGSGGIGMGGVGFGTGIGAGAGIGTGIGTGIDSTAGIGFGATPSIGFGSTPSIGIGSLQPGGLRADLFGRLPNLTGSGMMLGSGSSTGLLDFLTTPTLQDPFLTAPPTQRSPTLGGSSPGATSAGGAFLANPFCRPEDFTC